MSCSGNSGPVVIIAPPGDAHALVVAARIENLGCEAVIWDSGRLPARDHLTLGVSESGRRSVVLESSACGTIDLHTVRSIWWRRPGSPVIPSSVSNAFMRGYCRGETYHLLRGALSALSGKVYNDPELEERAMLKPFQLWLAYDIGFKLPDTLITSSPHTASEFFRNSESRVVFKPFRTPAGHSCATQECDQQSAAQFERLRNAPVIFQERIHPHQDVRVAVIGDQIFAAVSSSELLDWRVDGGLKWEAHQLPSKVEGMIRSFMRNLGLALGHLDFRLTSDGEYVFFEVNPSGQFLFLEVEDHRVEATTALASLLAGADG